MSIRYYNINDILSFSIQNNGNYFGELLDTTRISFENYKIEKNNNALDFSIQIGPFTPKSGNFKILDDNYRIRKNSLYFSDQRKFATWKTEISELESNPIIRIQPNLAGYVTKPLNIVEFFIQYCLLKRDYSVIHASGLSENGNVILLPSTSGGGKTTISLSLVERGYNFLGDNYIIIGKNVAYSYLTPLNIFFYNRVPIIEKSLTGKQKTSLAIRRLLYHLTGGYIKIFKKINPRQIFSNQFASQGQIKKLCFLEPNEKYDRDIGPPRRLQLGEAVKKMRYNMELEWLMFSNYMFSYSYMYPKSLFGTFWEKWEKTLVNNLDNVTDIFSLGVPSSYRSDMREKVIESLTEL